MTDIRTPAQKPDPWHAHPLALLVERLATDPRRGLAPGEAVLRLARAGPNELLEAPPPSRWRRFAAQFNELVVWILLAAAAIAAAVGDRTDAAAILAIVVLNAVLGFLQEAKAERALAALRKLSAPTARVVRGGAPAVIPARELVPGDLIEVEGGDQVPADARLVEAFGLKVQEAALTGESVPAEKRSAGELPEAAALGDRHNAIFMGTVAAAGRAAAVVTATGMTTELGRIAGELGREELEPTPLQKRLAELGRIIVYVCLAVTALVFALFLARGGALVEVLMVSVSLAVVAVPEGLPAVVTITLALGLERMVRRHALIRKLPSVETLGCVTVICSDKTGTLTRNEMTVERLVAGGRAYAVTGQGYAPRGDFIEDLRPVPPGARPAESLRNNRLRSVPGRQSPPGDPLAARLDPEPRSEAEHFCSTSDLVLALTAGARCSHARVVRAEEEGGGGFRVIGDPTEGALLVAAAKAGIAIEPPPAVLHAIPFDSERKAMSVVLDEPAAGGRAIFTKGAAEVVLAMCDRERRERRDVPLDGDRRAEILAAAAAMAGAGLRALALAFAPLPPGVAPGEAEERRLSFLGLAGMGDPPREEAREAVRRCGEAGIRPVMITGDHALTALSIARSLGIAGPGDRAVTGPEIEAASDDDLGRLASTTQVYARVSAAHKLRIVRALKARGEVVAMTGDGVNDAIAIKAADIGIAMGATGTDVTKEAADMVLTDDNFASIVNAVEEGRGIFENIQKFVEYLLSCNIGSILFMVAASVVGWPLPLFPVQLLWMNLVTNGLPALALALEPPEPGVMGRPPRPPREPMIGWAMGARMLRHGALMGAATAAAFAATFGPSPGDLAAARSTAFCVLVLSQLFFALAARSPRIPLLRLGIGTNPWLLAVIAGSAALQAAVVSLPALRPVFHVGDAPVAPWLILALSAAPLAAAEALKLFAGPRRARSQGGSS